VQFDATVYVCRLARVRNFADGMIHAFAGWSYVSVVAGVPAIRERFILQIHQNTTNTYY